MLQPERMSKLFIIGSKSQLPAVVSTLHDMKVAHFVEHKKGDYDLCDPLEELDDVSKLLVECRSVLANLDAQDVDCKPTAGTIQDIEKDIAAVKKEVLSIVEELKTKKDALQLLAEQQRIIDILNLIGCQPVHLHPSESLVHFLGHASDLTVLDKIERITDRVYTVNADHKGKQLIGVFAEKSARADIERVLSEHGFEELDVSAVSQLNGEADRLIPVMGKRKAQLENDIQSLEKKRAALEQKHVQKLAGYEQFLAAQTDKAQAPLSFGQTKEAFFLTAYVPLKDQKHVEKELQKTADNKLHIEEQDLGDEEEIPIKLNNNSFHKPFEFFTNLYSLPGYKEFDPTKLMVYTFPLFMGFMLGDFVYGLIIVMLFAFLRKKVPAGHGFFTAMIYAGVATMLWGAFYGEFAGFEPYHGPIVRTHDFNELMLLALIIGAIHVNIGLLIGFFLEVKNHGLWHAITHKVSWILIQVGGYFFIGPLFGLVQLATDTPFYIGMGVFILGALLLFKAEGLIGIMELPSIVSHLLSYARLMAVGLASVFIAVMVNQLTLYLVSLGILWYPVAAIAFIFGQTFAIALGILSPSLHSIRLHYVEFFTKFYKGGGKRYAPFGAQEEKSLL